MAKDEFNESDDRLRDTRHTAGDELHRAKFCHIARGNEGAEAKGEDKGRKSDDDEGPAIAEDPLLYRVVIEMAFDSFF